MPTIIYALDLPPEPPVDGCRSFGIGVAIDPRPKGNSKAIMPIGKRCGRCGKAGRHVLVPRKQDVAAERALATLLRLAVTSTSTAPPEPITKDVHLSVVIVLPIRKSWSKAKRAAALAGTCRPTSNKGATGPIPDLGNLEKLLDDALEKSGWLANDSVIADRQSSKVYGERPGYLITVRELPTWAA